MWIIYIHSTNNKTEYYYSSSSKYNKVKYSSEAVISTACCAPGGCLLLLLLPLLFPRPCRSTTSRAGVGTHTVVLVTAVRPLLRNGASGTLASAMLETMKRALFLAHCALAAAAVVV